LKGFHLVGGTALALKAGHRKSIDIELFSDFNFDSAALLENLATDFNFVLHFSAQNTLKGSIENIQVDLLAHRYPLVNQVEIIDKISMLSMQDILAMKLNAISTSGQRVKDFVDVYFLLKQYSLADMIDFYKLKYAQYSEINVLKSLVYFDDVDLTDWPQIIAEPELKWKQVKQRLIRATKDYMDG
jgi:hypothetical protein